MARSGDIGRGQSPVDICGWIPSDGPSPKFEYASVAVRVERLQGLPLIQFARGSGLRLGDDRFRLLQIHWHTPAEHTIEGEEFAAELHLVHRNEQRELLVAGTVYRIGEADDAIQRLIEESPQTGQEEGAVPSLCAADYAPDALGFYHYSGSLTAPPFSEPVQWYVGRTIRTVSQRQVEQLQALTHGPNARALQDRNGRSIVFVGCEM